MIITIELRPEDLRSIANYAEEKYSVVMRFDTVRNNISWSRLIGEAI